VTETFERNVPVCTLVYSLMRTMRSLQVFEAYCIVFMLSKSKTMYR